ncbi:uncharacterized protein LOC134274418 [Saccostrea cucullata]|uniref:uncharacterized protein LOC134274418 n=1 Tax=Saccostrea cuccullata TaxID=36930 RepID=UPI002ED22AB3
MSIATRSPKKQPSKWSEKKRSNTLDVLTRPGEDTFSSIKRLSQSKILVEPYSLYKGIMALRNEDLKRAAILQYHVARQQGLQYWIKEFRRNCQCDMSENWIDENLPSLDGKKLHIFKKSGAAYAPESSRDIRLATNPNIKIIQENAADNDTGNFSMGKVASSVVLVESSTPRHYEKPSCRQSSSRETYAVSDRTTHMLGSGKHIPSQDVSTSSSDNVAIRKVRSRKRNLSVTVSQPSTKLKSSQHSEYCMLSTCFSLDKKVRRHCTKSHMPSMFQMVSTDSNNVGQCVQALRWLIRAALGERATLDDAVQTVNRAGKIPPTISLNPLHSDLFRQACRFLEVQEPEKFTLHPVNSPAVLLFWRCIMVLLDKCNQSQQKYFFHFKSVSETSMPFCNPISFNTPISLNIQSDSELPSDLEEYPLPDGSTSDDMEVAEQGELPAVFDSHFHLDRSSKKIWGVNKGHTVEDVLHYSDSNFVSCKPSIPVRVVGGIIVYSEPETYPNISFTLEGPWRVAVGVHPKHYRSLSDEKMSLLHQLLHHPKVVALGECGLDRSVSPSEWSQQEEVFVKILSLAKPCKPLVLHLRGPVGDEYGSDVNARCIMLMERYCSRAQWIHVHCFKGKVDVVETWLKKFPNTYFGVTAAVRTFDENQITGLKAIPRNKLVLESDAPYFPLGRAKVSTPAYLGETASLVAVNLGIRPSELMQVTLENARYLYRQKVGYTL